MTNAYEESTGNGLFMAMEVSEATWRLCFTDLSAERQVEVAAWACSSLMAQVDSAKKHFGLSPSARVRVCYEAGRNGFSLHRFLESKGFENVVVDPASIEVNRRGRRRKTDRMDAHKLTRMLVRYHVYGESKCWQVCRVPTPEQEAARRLDREHERLKKERTGHVARIKSLLRLHGNPEQDVMRLKAGKICDYAGRRLAPEWQEEISRELERLELVEFHLKELHRKRQEALKASATPADRDANQLMRFHGIGEVGATALARQFFSWREFANVRQVGAAAGLTGCPYNSGASQVEQGISKAGNRRVRCLAVELAWLWLRYQSGSALSQWYQARFGSGAARLKRIGIVALARKLLVALWKFLRKGLVPEGAILSPEP